MHPFTYHKPVTVAEARELLESQEDAKLLAGGMTLFPTMKMRLAAPTDLVDLAGIEELYELNVTPEQVTVGAMVTHAEVADSRQLQAAVPALSTLAQHIGDAQVRNRGTLGGSLANSDPAADYPAAALALNATVRTDQRDIPIDLYFTGMFETALNEYELITSVTFERPVRAAYAKFPNPASRYAVVGVFVAQMSDGNVRVAITGAASCAYRDERFEQALTQSLDAVSLEGITPDASGFNEDVFASAEYRAHLVTVMTRQAVEELVSQNA